MLSGRDGQPGRDGINGQPGLPGDDGLPGQAGPWGVSFKGDPGPNGKY